MLKNLDATSLNNIDMISRSNSIKRSYKDDIFENNDSEKPKINFKSKTILKIFISTLIVFICLLCKLTFKEAALNNSNVIKVVNEYNKDWSKEYILEKVEMFSDKIYGAAKYVLPDSIKNTITQKYNDVIKPQYLAFNLHDAINSYIKGENSESSENLENVENIETQQVNSKDVVVEENNSNVEEENKENGVGGAEPIETEETISAISSMNTDVETIRSKNISIVSPTNGTITSIYGARDEIFEGVNSYHTGTDIANKKGTNITSATTGKVKSVVYNNKYYGNYVEVETDGVIFKYAHMDSISVGEGSDIKQGDLVGYMGSTGMSTGPHLHFEIKIDSRTVDPQELVSL